MATGKLTSLPLSPNYANASVLVSGNGNSATVTQKGYVYVVAANGATGASKPIFRLEINGTIVFAQTGRDDNYSYMGSGLYPVSPGDVVKIHTATFSGTNAVYFVAV